MKLMIATAATAIALGGAAFAEGDADKGAKEFNKCKSCHMIVADDGTEIVKGGRTGPIQYDLASLLIDPYVELPSAFQSRLLDYCSENVRQRTGMAEDKFRESFIFCSLTRNLQSSN